MTKVAYITLMGFVLFGPFLMPDLTELMKIYLIAANMTFCVGINLLFQWRKLREYIVNQIIGDVVMHMIRDKDVRTVLSKLNEPTKGI